MGFSVQRIFDIPLLNEVGGICNAAGATKSSYLSFPNLSTISHPNTLPLCLCLYVTRNSGLSGLKTSLSASIPCRCWEVSELHMKKRNQGYLWAGLDPAISKQKPKSRVPSRQHDTRKVNQMTGYGW